MSIGSVVCSVLGYGSRRQINALAFLAKCEFRKILPVLCQIYSIYTLYIGTLLLFMLLYNLKSCLYIYV